MAATRILFGVTFLMALMAFGFPLDLAAQQGGAGSATMRAAPDFRTVRPVIRGQDYAVSSMKAQATAAAVEILDAGGNAFDAAVAGQAVLALVDPANNGIGADAVLLVYDAEAEQVYSINAEGMAPALATIEWYEEHNNGELPRSDGLLAASTPGVVDAWYILLDRWGTMTFEQTLRRAIAVAAEGFPVSEAVSRSISRSQKIRQYPTTMDVYFPDGRAPAPGEIFRNPGAARVLEKIVEAERENAHLGRSAALKAGRDRFYKGDIARDMARFFEENGGLYRYEDFAAFTAQVETPVSTNYRGYDVYKNPSASQGPAELFTLNILEGFDLAAMRHNSADYIHTSAEALKLAFADREKYLGDQDVVPIPYEGLLSKDYAAERRELVDPDSASLEFRPGSPERFMENPPPTPAHPRVTFAGEADHEGDTSYIAVVDGDRNMVSFEPSLHSGFGTGVVVGDLGFSFTCRGDYYSLVHGEANALAPGKRPRSTLQSTLVMKDGEPWGILGSPGGDDQIMRTMQTLLNMVEFNMNVQQAIESPRWSTRSFPASPFPHTMYPGDLSVERGVSAEVRAVLEAKGHALRVRPEWSMGSNAAIIVDHEHGVLAAGVDPRTEGVAWAK